MLTSDFDYELPEAAIAQEAIEPRDASRLLEVNGMVDRRFSELPELLTAGDLLVVNRTRVRRARLRGVREGTGGAVELLLLRPLAGRRWEALVKPARRMRPGVRLEFGAITAEVASPADEGRITVDFTGGEDVEELLGVAGEVPLPPYFYGELADADRYQTIFAKVTGSAAAPTAALHFTPRLIERLHERGIEIAEVELEVGLDTFRPLATATLDEHTMHRERYVVPVAAAEAVEAARRRQGRVIAVGTTVMRTLETVAAAGGTVVAGEGESELFIQPGFTPHVVDALITNFHAPRTTLTVLVAALLGAEWRVVYATALRRGYRFLSFGDAMFVADLRSAAP